ncbi:Fur family transcriptional regulator [Zobellia uliginosa]|nr:transcriptional repressor [Zobellia uliginosa]
MKRRNTPTKQAVLSVLSSSTKAMSPDAIKKKIDVSIDRATIYRVLNRFCDDGVLHRVVADDGKQYFAMCQKCDENEKPLQHFHFRCTHCETIECLPLPVNYTIAKGYEVKNVNCVLIGVCKDCA